MDLTSLHDAYRGTGSKPFPPERMLAIALVEILSGNTSPARWHVNATTRDQCKLVGRGIRPARATWYDFRNRCGKFVEDVHQQIVRKAIDKKLIDPKQCALDGTFTAAAASRHKIRNLKQINRRLSQIKRAIGMLDDPAQVAAKQPMTRTPRWIAPTPKGRQQQLNRFRQAKRKLLQNIQENRARHSRHRRNESKMTVSPTDIDAVIGRDKTGVIRPLYNHQFMTDCASDVTVAYGVFAQSNDSGTLIGMIHKTQHVTQGRLKEVHADSSYCSILDLKDCDTLGIDLLAPVQDPAKSNRKSISGDPQIPSSQFEFEETTRSLTCPAGHTMKFVREAQVPRADGRRLGELLYRQSGERCSACDLRERCLSGKSSSRTVSRQSEQGVLDKQREKMSTEAGKHSSRLRGQVIERRFADGKQHRGQGHQNGRGLLRVSAEVGLLVIAQNLLTLYNLEKRTQNPPP